MKTITGRELKVTSNKTGDNINEVRDYLSSQADPFNTLIPIYFYTKMYKLSIDLINSLNN